MRYQEEGAFVETLSAGSPGKIKFCARGAPKFRRFTKTCVISTPRACFFYGSERTVDSNESAGEAIRFTQRTLPGKNKILCAWRADIPEILEIFPILSQDVGINFALSRRRAPA